MKTKIIGHRGAAGLALENTEESLAEANKLNVDYIEFDVRLTKDKKLVVHHYSNLITDEAKNNWFKYTVYKFINKIKVLDESNHIHRIFGNKTGFLRIRNHTLQDLRKIKHTDGSKIITLNQALKITGNTPVIVETKDYGTAELILDEIKKFPDKNIRVASFKIRELAKMRRLDKEIFLYGLEHIKLTDIVADARRHKLNGIGMNFWLLNPLTYRMAKRRGLDFYVYTFNLKFLAKFILYLYPDISICTDHPEWFIESENSLYD